MLLKSPPPVILKPDEVAWMPGKVKPVKIVEVALLPETKLAAP